VGSRPRFSSLRMIIAIRSSGPIRQQAEWEAEWGPNGDGGSFALEINDVLGDTVRNHIRCKNNGHPCSHTGHGMNKQDKYFAGKKGPD